MTLGIGRGMDLNFTTLAALLAAARASAGFAVRSLAERTGFHENKVKGHLSWARAMGLVCGAQLTPLAQLLLERDASLAYALSRGVCYVEISSNPDAEVAWHICNELLPRIDADNRSTSTKEIVSMLVSDAVGNSSKATQQPQRDADLFLRSLRSVHGFGPIGALLATGTGRYATGPVQVGPELTGYALLRRWPEEVPYLRMSDAHRLVAPLLLAPARFAQDLAVLERRGVVMRVTSSGLDQVYPVAGRRPEETLWLDA